MPFIEILQALVSLDFGFFVDIVMGNLFWIFGFYAAGYIFSGGKSPLISATIYAAMVLVSVDIFILTGFSIYTAFALGLLYMLRVPLLLFLEKSKGGSKYLALAWILSWYFVLGLVAILT